jgi:hypothetical protein
MDVLFDLNMKKKHLFLDIISTNIDTLVEIRSREAPAMA